VKKLLIGLVLATTTLTASSALAAEGDAATPAPFRVAQLGFFAGSWHGPLFGGEADETWMPPRDGTMLGSFRLTWPGTEKRLYELLIIEELANGEVVMNFRHFGPGMKLWEDEIDQPLNFVLVDVGLRTARFESSDRSQKPARFIFATDETGRALIVTVQSLTPDGQVAEEFAARYTRR